MADTREEKIDTFMKNFQEIFRMGLAACDAMKTEKDYAQCFPLEGREWMLEVTHTPRRVITFTLVE